VVGDGGVQLGRRDDDGVGDSTDRADTFSDLADPDVMSQAWR
jgi:hypothetical protein